MAHLTGMPISSASKPTLGHFPVRNATASQSSLAFFPKCTQGRVSLVKPAISSATRRAKLPSSRNIRISAHLFYIPLRPSSIAKSESIVGIKSDRHIKIGDGSAVVAFERINDAPVSKGVSALGVYSNSLIKISDGSFVLAFVCITDAPVAHG
jgi:hypothetical protein